MRSRDRTTSRTLNKLMDQLEHGDFSWIERQRMNVKVTQLEKFDEDQTEAYRQQCLEQGCSISCDDHDNMIIDKLMLNEVFLAEKDTSKTSMY